MLLVLHCFDGVIACCAGNDIHVLMMVDYNVSVVLVDWIIVVVLVLGVDPVIHTSAVHLVPVCT